jgi:AcrR family transcriptional regulator
VPTKASATRAAILERAVQIASTEGLEGLTIGRLSSELGMSKSGLFAHFGSKEDLQLATIEAAAHMFYEEVVVPDFLEREVFAGGCFWAAVAAEFDDRPGAVRDCVSAGVNGWLHELERQATLAGAADTPQLAFEIYSLGLGANTYSRLLADEQSFSRARAAIDRRLSLSLGGE